MDAPHPHVPHPVHLRRHLHRDGMGPVGRANDWLATHLAVLFGIAWTIWLFFVVPVVAYFLPARIQGRIFFFSSGWVQLFALPLMIYVGNKLQRSSDAQSDVMHQGMTHIATVTDQSADRLDTSTQGGIRTVLDAVTKLSDDIAGLAEAVQVAAAADRARPPGPPKLQAPRKRKAAES